MRWRTPFAVHAKGRVDCICMLGEGVGDSCECGVRSETLCFGH